MLGRKTYTPEELDDARTALDRQLAAYDALVEALDGATSDPKVAAALAEFEPLFLENLTLALDRRFVHRLRVVTGKDGNALNEVRVLSDSIVGHGGMLVIEPSIKLDPGTSVLGIEPGATIMIDKAGFHRLSEAFLEEIEARFC